MMLHCLAQEIVHAMLNACCSRNFKMSHEEGHTTAFKNLSGNIFGHLHVPGLKKEAGGWCDITKPVTLRESWAGKFRRIPTLPESYSS
jgi:hypothetical protein